MPKKERNNKSGDGYHSYRGFFYVELPASLSFSPCENNSILQKNKTWKIRTLENFLCALIRYSKRSINNLSKLFMHL